ncbi:phosphoribosyltransferase-like protein [Facklamia sp. P12932]|uniref:phosphoribosyltransferase-like protein n=1 Tax=Facklamia sp. P12932 TaxID=3421947 RepID=UPI003D180CF2
MKHNLDIQTFNKIKKIFEIKSWETNDDQKSLFMRTCRTLKLLDNNEQEVFLQLLDMMEYYTISDYESLLITVLKKMLKQMKVNKFYFSPIISNRKNNDIKSSLLVNYLLKSNSFHYDSDLSNMKMILQIDLTKTKINKVNETDSYLVLVDDFIGTGSSAIKSAKYFINRGVDREKIIILSLVTMNKGKENIFEKGFKFFFATESLSLSEKIDLHKIEDNDIFRKNIEIISKKLGVDTKDFWGFENSEAVLSMVRVPNNTIGAFWKGKKKDNIPFPRFS